MEEIKVLIAELISEKYPEFKMSNSESEIKIFRSTYFSFTLKKQGKEFHFTIYTGLLAYLLNKNFKNKIISLKSDVEKILTDNNFKFIYVNMNG